MKTHACRRQEQRSRNNTRPARMHGHTLYIYMYSPCPCPPLYQYKPNQVDVYYYYYCAITYMYPCLLPEDGCVSSYQIKAQQQKLYVLHKNTRLDMDMIPSAANLKLYASEYLVYPRCLLLNTTVGKKLITMSFFTGRYFYGCIYIKATLTFRLYTLPSSFQYKSAGGLDYLFIYFPPCALSIAPYMIVLRFFHPR